MVNELRLTELEARFIPFWVAMLRVRVNPLCVCLQIGTFCSSRRHSHRINCLVTLKLKVTATRSVFSFSTMAPRQTSVSCLVPELRFFLFSASMKKNTSIFFEAAHIDRKQVLLEIANASVTWSSHVLFDRAVEVSFKEKCFTMKVEWLIKPIDSFQVQNFTMVNAG